MFKNLPVLLTLYFSITLFRFFLSFLEKIEHLKFVSNSVGNGLIPSFEIQKLVSPKIYDIIEYRSVSYIEMFRINTLRSKDYLTSNEFMMTNARNLIYILVYNKLRKILSNIIFFTRETDIYYSLNLDF